MAPGSYRGLNEICRSSHGLSEVSLLEVIENEYSDLGFAFGRSLMASVP